MEAKYKIGQELYWTDTHQPYSIGNVIEVMEYEGFEPAVYMMQDGIFSEKELGPTSTELREEAFNRLGDLYDREQIEEMDYHEVALILRHHGDRNISKGIK